MGFGFALLVHTTTVRCGLIYSDTFGHVQCSAEADRCGSYPFAFEYFQSERGCGLLLLLLLLLLTNAHRQSVASGAGSSSSSSSASSSRLQVGVAKQSNSAPIAYICAVIVGGVRLPNPLTSSSPAINPFAFPPQLSSTSSGRSSAPPYSHDRNLSSSGGGGGASNGLSSSSSVPSSLEVDRGRARDDVATGLSPERKKRPNPSLVAASSHVYSSSPTSEQGRDSEACHEMEESNGSNNVLNGSVEATRQRDLELSMLYKLATNKQLSVNYCNEVLPESYRIQDFTSTKAFLKSNNDDIRRGVKDDMLRSFKERDYEAKDVSELLNQIYITGILRKIKKTADATANPNLESKKQRRGIETQITSADRNAISISSLSLGKVAVSNLRSHEALNSELLAREITVDVGMLCDAKRSLLMQYADANGVIDVKGSMEVVDENESGDEEVVLAREDGKELDDEGKSSGTAACENDAKSVDSATSSSSSEEETETRKRNRRAPGWLLNYT